MNKHSSINDYVTKFFIWLPHSTDLFFTKDIPESLHQKTEEWNCSVTTCFGYSIHMHVCMHTPTHTHTFTFYVFTYTHTHSPSMYSHTHTHIHLLCILFPVSLIYSTFPGTNAGVCSAVYICSTNLWRLVFPNHVRLHCKIQKPTIKPTTQI